MASVAKPSTMPKPAAPLPAPNADFYELAEKTALRIASTTFSEANDSSATIYGCGLH